MRQKTRALTVLAALAASAVLVVAPSAAAVGTTTTVLVSSANPSTAGQSVTLTATVTGAAPGGSVDFVDSGVLLGSVPISSGVATLATSSLAVGAHALTATYSGDVNNSTSSGTLTQTVEPPVKPPKVKLVASRTEVSVGDKVRLRWHSKGADVATASGAWSGAQKTKGSADVRIAERGTHVFKLTVENDAGARTATVKVVATRKAKTLELVVTEEPTIVGSEVELTADGLASGEDYTVRLDGKPILTGKADKKGDVARTFVLAKTTPEGALPLTITGSNPGRVGTAILNVIAPKTFDVELAHDEVYKRDKQKITVTGLLPGEEVTISLLGKVLVKGKADESGSFSHTFRATKPLGEQTVSVVGLIPGRNGKATFTVLDPGRGPNNGG